MFIEFLQGRYFKHPLHPMLVHLPVGLWVMSLISDIVYKISHITAWLTVSYCCIGVGVLAAVLAATTGLAEYVSIPLNTRPRKMATQHMILNILVLALYVWDFFARRAVGGLHEVDLSTGVFVLNIVSVSILAVSGYIGGRLIYEFGIGLRPQVRNEEKRAHLRRIA